MRSRRSDRPFPGLRRLAWSILLLVQVGCREAPTAGPEPGVDVRHYEVSARLDPATTRLDARVALDVAHPDSLTRLTLALEGMDVDTVRVDGAVVAARHRGDRLVVPVAGGREASRIEIRYGGRPEIGLRVERFGTQQVVFTDSWPDAGRGWLPGVHHPSDPATWGLTLTLPLGFEAVASGQRLGVDTLESSVQHYWRLDVPVPTYAFAFAVGDFTVVEDALGDTLAVHYVMLAGEARRAAQLHRTPRALSFFSDQLGPYPFPVYASVEVPLGYGGMENAAAAFLDAGLFSSGTAESVQVHELAHQWFGNRVVLAGWRDLWLSEGTATYLEALFVEHVDGADAARERWIEIARVRPGRPGAGSVLAPPSVRSPGAHLTRVLYDKGGSVLYALRRLLGDATFHKALREVYSRFAGLPLSTETFRTVLEASSGRDLRVFFDAWVYGDGLPVLRTDWEPEGRRLAWRVEDHAGMLEGIPFDLFVRQGPRARIVSGEAGQLVVPEWGTSRPTVASVGIMMNVR